MEEEIYIPYGQDSIALNLLMTKLADGVLNYVNGLSWSSNRKQMFLNAYSDIMSKGIVGASNDTGQWTLNLKNNIDLSSKSQKELDMYHEAAYFILNQMKGVTPKAKEEEKKKSDIKPYDNAAHTKGFEAYVANTLFGGRNWDLNADWDDAYDPIDSKTGLRPTTNRALKLADLLEGYSNSLKPEDMNFEGTPFKDIDDLKGRFSNAVNQLRDGTFDLNDKEALNQLGLDWKKYLSDGSDDLITLEDGTVTTRGAYAEALRKQEADKLAAELAAAKQKAIAELKARQGVLNLVSGVHAVDARNNPQGYLEFLADTYGVGQQGFNTINTEIQKLLNKYLNGLTNREKRQLGNFLYYIRQNNPNYKLSNLTDLEWAELNTHENLKSKNRNGFVRLPWKTLDGRYTYADDLGNVYFMKPSNHGQYTNPTPFVKGAAYNLYKNLFLKSKRQINAETPVLSQDTDILVSDVTSMLGDIVSLGGGWAGVGGGVATLLSDLYGDIRRGKDTWDTIKNVGANIGWGLAGIIPGTKLAKLAKNAARVYAAIQSAGILLSDDVKNSWIRLANGESITAKDFENFKWTLHAITGIVNVGRGVATDRNILKKVYNSNKVNVTTKLGTKKSVDLDVIKAVNKEGGRKGLAAAEAKFKELVREEAKEGSFKFSDSGKKWYNPTKYSAKARKIVDDDTKLLEGESLGVNKAAAAELLAKDKAKPYVSILGNPFRGLYWRRNNPFSKSFWNEGGPNRGGLTFALGKFRSGNTQDLQQQQNLLPKLLENLNPKQLLLPYIKKPYNTPTTTSLERMSYSRGLPQPGGEHIGQKGSYVPKRLLRTDVKNSNVSNIRKNLQELNNAWDSYGVSPKRPASTIKGGYKQSGNIQLGSYNKKIDETNIGFTKDMFGNITVTIGKKKSAFKDIQTARQYMAKQLFELSKKSDHSKIADVLRYYKSKHILRQGGQILNFNLDKTISDFLKQQR